MKKEKKDRGQAKRNMNYQQAWLKIYDLLVEYKNEFGHVNIPARAKYKGIALGNWVVRQRTIKDKLTKNQIKLLRKLKFDWKPKKNDWDKLNQRLIKFYQKHGHTVVPVKYKKDLNLSWWVLRQRKEYFNGTLSEEKIKRLNHLHFAWSPNDIKWEEKLSQFVSYRTLFGDFDVPSSKEFISLNFWKNEQIRKYRLGKLPEDRYQKLREIGYDLSKIDPKSSNLSQV